MVERIIFADEGINRYLNRLEKVYQSPEIQLGLRGVSTVGWIAEQVLYEELGWDSNLALPPIDTSIQEYTGRDFEVINPLNGKVYSLIQSPQIMKETAAVVFGSNWRRTFCYRPESGDATHAQIFQQVDVELRNGDGSAARQLAEEILRRAYREIKNEDLPPVPQLDYITVVSLYGDDQPNLYHGLFLDTTSDGRVVLRIKSPKAKEYFNSVVGRQLEHLPDVELLLHGPLLESESVIWGTVEELRKIREEALRRGITESKSWEEVSAYWLINMPYARYNKEGKLEPVHHVMSMPWQAIENPSFSFSGLTDNELTNLRCDSYDLVVCTEKRL